MLIKFYRKVNKKLHIGKTCPYCQFTIKNKNDYLLCAKCKTPHHIECWKDNGKCTTFACNHNNYILGNQIVESDKQPNLQDFMFNKPIVQGTFTWSTGAKYIGGIMDGLRHGQGLMTYPNGKKYEGNFRNDMRDGYGVMTYPDGRKLAGEWKRNEFVK